MAKKRKNKKAFEEDESLFSELDPNIKKTIAGIIFLTFTSVLVLALFNLAGDLGQMADEFLAKIFGVGRYFIPVGFLLLSIMYFRRLENKIYLSLWIGLLLIVFGFLGLLHLFHDPKEFSQLAKEGDGGGYVGYLIASLLLKTVNKLAGSIILIASSVVGILIVFNGQMAKFLDKPQKEEEAESEVEDKDGPRVKIEEQKISLFSRLKD
ncbi:MAG: hypothetical protein GF347_00860, partial [Candidatus Moranbacteria bacterium]|nr:hypothetical protein [Candidatus Moranbacteria bacterium]